MMCRSYTGGVVIIGYLITFVPSYSKNLYLLQENQAADCRFTFSSRQSKEGVFTSPDYPRPYPANTVCTYDFTGRRSERVQISFMNFDLDYPDGDSRDPYDCEDVDAVRVFLVGDMEDTNVGTYCGRKRPPMLMSHNNQFHIVFHTMPQQTNSHGFNATYKFVEHFGIEVGEPINSMPCGFNFSSSVATNGTFSSPNFPGLYPRNTVCHYLFHGAHNERVRITFPYLDVEGVRGCTEDSQSDYVEFSNFKVNLPDRKLKRLCGLKGTTTSPQGDREVESDGNFFRVTFKSNEIYDATGFEAYYQFLRPQDVYATREGPNTHQQIEPPGGSNGRNGGHCVTSLHTLIVVLILAMFNQLYS